VRYIENPEICLNRSRDRGIEQTQNAKWQTYAVARKGRNHVVQLEVEKIVVYCNAGVADQTGMIHIQAVAACRSW